VAWAASAAISRCTSAAFSDSLFSFSKLVEFISFQHHALIIVRQMSAF
jgi:hypothetical protein